MHPIPPRPVRLAALLLGLLLLGACSRYAPVEVAFEASPARIAPGQESTLSWDLGIDPDGPLPRPGVVEYELVLEAGSIDVTDLTSLTVSPEATTTYELIARWRGNEARATATVEVLDGDDVDYVVDRGETLTVDLTALAPGTSGAGLAFRILSGPRLGEASIDGSSLTYTAPDADGADEIVVEISDGSATTTATLTIVVGRGDGGLALSDATREVDEDGTLTVDLSALASGADGGALSFRVAAGPRLGEASIDGSSLTYVPEPDAYGSDALAIEASDGAATALAILSIEVLPVNDAPVTTDAAYAASPWEPLVIDLTDLASDVDGDALTFEIVTDPTLGEAAVEGSSLTYAADSGAFGSDEIVVRASDGEATADIVLSLDVGARIVDPVGDHSFDLDATEIRWYLDGDDAVIEIELTEERRAVGFMNLDLDRDPATGGLAEVAEYCADAPSHAELEIDFFEGGYIIDLVGEDELAPPSITTAGAVTTVRFPATVVGGDFDFDLYAIIGDNGPSDCVPGEGGGLQDGPEVPPVG